MMLALVAKVATTEDGASVIIHQLQKKSIFLYFFSSQLQSIPANKINNGIEKA